MSNSAVGFSGSLLLHGLILAAAFVWLKTPPPEAPAQPLPLTLAMFTPPPVVTPVVPVEPVTPPPPTLAPEPVPEVEKAPPKPKPKPKPPVKKPPPAPPKLQPPAPKRVQPEPPPVVAPPPVQRVSPPPPKAAPAPNVAALENGYKDTLRAAIERAKDYPMRARRLRQQGTVVLSIEMLPDGRIKRVSVEKSSGSELLDQAAVDSVKTVDGKYRFPAGISRKSWRFTLPVHFSLR